MTQTRRPWPMTGEQTVAPRCPVPATRHRTRAFLCECDMDFEALALLSWPEIQEHLNKWREDELTGNCLHESRALRIKKTSNGGEQYRGQCLKCGHYTQPIPKSQALKKASGKTIKPADDTLRDAWYERHREIHAERHAFLKKIKEIKNRIWWSRYNAYLQTDAWKTIRQRVMQRACNRCEGCGIARATQVHHLTYDRVGEEMLFDLVAICDDCHAKVHESTRESINE